MTFCNLCYYFYYLDRIRWISMWLKRRMIVVFTGVINKFTIFDSICWYSQTDMLNLLAAVVFSPRLYTHGPWVSGSINQSLFEICFRSNFGAVRVGQMVIKCMWYVRWNGSVGRVGLSWLKLMLVLLLTYKYLRFQCSCPGP